MLILPQEQEVFIREQSEAAYPNECCGILIGEIGENEEKTVKSAVAIQNAREDGAQHNRFLITAQDLFAAETIARSKNWEVLGFYHSHPDCPAVPSGYDKEHALPFYSYIIVSVEKGEAKNITNWQLLSDRSNFIEETLKRRSLND